MSNIVSVHMLSVLLGVVIGIAVNFQGTVSGQQFPLFHRSIGVELFDLAWSPDGQVLGVASSTGIKILTNELEEVTELGGYAGNVTALSWNPNGQQLAGGGGKGDGTIRIWDYEVDTDTFNSLHLLRLDPSTIVFLLAWSPDGSKLASLTLPDPSLTRVADLVGEIQIWNANTWRPLYEQPHYYYNPVRSLAWSPDSEAVIYGGLGVYAVNVETSQDIFYAPTPQPIDSVSWSPGNQIAFHYQGYLQFVDGETGEFLSRWQYPFGIFGMDWSPNGGLLAAETGAGSVTILHAHTGEPLQCFEVATSLWTLDWSSDGNRLATGSIVGEVEIWDTTYLPDGSSVITSHPFTIANFDCSHTLEVISVS